MSALLTLVYAREPIPASGPSVFLAGPTPTAGDVPSWRPAAIEELLGIISGLPVGQLDECGRQVLERAKRIGELSLTSTDQGLLATTELMIAAGQHIDAAGQQLLQAIERIRAYQPRL